MSEKTLFDDLWAVYLPRIKKLLKGHTTDLTNVTGTLPYTNVPSSTGSTRGGITLTRDLGNTAASPHVVGIQGRDVASTAPTNGDALVWVSATSKWTPAAVSGGSSLAWFSVKDYGAAGDGSTDDTTAVGSAITALVAAGRGVLYFPAGVYKTSGGFTLSVPALILGDGSAGFDGATDKVSMVTCTSSTAVLFTVTAKVAKFESIALYNTTTVTGGAGIQASSSSGVARVDCESISVANFYIGIDIQVGTGWTLRGSWITGWKKYAVKVQNTVLPDAGDWAISDSGFFASVYDSDSAIRLESSGGGKIVNCKFNTGLDGFKANHMIDMDASGIAGTPTSILLISNCSFENYRGDGVHLVGGGWNMIALHGCQWGQYSNSTGRAIYISTLDDIIVDAAIFRGPSSPAHAIVIDTVNRAYIGAVVNDGFGDVLSTTSCTAIIDLSGGIPTAAPVGAQYVTLATDATLTSERVLTAGHNITLTDAGAGGNVTIATGDWSVLTNGSATSPDLIYAGGDVIMVYT